MTADSTHVLSPRATSDDLGSDELQCLLQEMLAGVRHHRETTLLAGFDSRGIVAAALASLSNSFAPIAPTQLENMETVRAAFNRVVSRALQDQPVHTNTRICLQPSEQSNGVAATGRQRRDEDVAQWLAVWLEQFCMNMNDVHPKAIEVVILRVEGCDNRQVAHRLGLTLRLVKRIVQDIHQGCQRTVKG